MNECFCLIVVGQTTEVYFVPFLDGSESKRAQIECLHPALIPTMMDDLAREFKWQIGHVNSTKKFVSYVRTLVCK